MERKDLLGINGKIFTGQGQAIASNAAPDVRILVVGNPCNTNCLIAMNNAKSVPAERWFAMTMLDQNRAVTQLALKAGTDTTAVTNLAIWGNHSSTMYPDFYNAKIGGKRRSTAVITDEAWFKDTFIPTVQQRGAAIIKARGLSSAASAANAVVDTVRGADDPDQGRRLVQRRRSARHGAYGIEAGLMYSYPLRSDGQKWEIVTGTEPDRIRQVEDHRDRKRAEGREEPGRRASRLRPHEHHPFRRGRRRRVEVDGKNFAGRQRHAERRRRRSERAAVAALKITVHVAGDGRRAGVLQLGHDLQPSVRQPARKLGQHDWQRRGRHPGRRRGGAAGQQSQRRQRKRGEAKSHYGTLTVWHRLVEVERDLRAGWLQPRYGAQLGQTSKRARKSRSTPDQRPSEI